MKRFLSAFTLVVAVSSGALAQADKDHQQHHPGGAPPQAQTTPAPPTAPAPSQMPMGQMMQNMPDRCRSMMQNMQACMGMMQDGRVGGMGQQGSHGTPGMSAQATPASPATKAYLEAAERMHGPMMEGVQATDPDVAFVRGMIPHHQAAIDMAKVVLQYGKDPQTKKLAEDVVREQQREITEMQEWLKKNAR